MTSARVVYAQSSDIKSRTFLEYRRDMKKKAIAELEILPWLQNAVRVKFGDPQAVVVKHGGDAELWFQWRGGISQDPDYMAQIGGKKFYYEFQLAEDADKLSHFDFKVSKVGKARGGKRTPHADREFFYIVKPLCRYAFVTPHWIMTSGKLGAVPAWGSRIAYRVPKAIFLTRTRPGGESLRAAIAVINAKNHILAFQHDFIAREGVLLCGLLERAVDERKIVKIIPSSLEGFYRVCFVLDKIGKTPQNAALWLVYLASFFDPRMPPLDFARFVFCLDFLFFKTRGTLAANELRATKGAVTKSLAYIAACARGDGSFATHPACAPLEETREVLFAVNLLEDIIQDLRYIYKTDDFAPIAKIFQTLPDCAKTCEFVTRRENSGEDSLVE